MDASLSFPSFQRPEDGAFVVGTGRCGSTLLSHALATHPDVLSVSEFFINLAPEPFPEGELSGEEMWSRLTDRASLMNKLLRIGCEPPEFLYPVDARHRFDRAGGVPRIATMTLPFLTDDPDDLLDRLAVAVPTFPRQSAAAHYRQLFGVLAGWFDRPRWVERSGASGFYTDQLVGSFPTARYVYLKRDAEATARSMSKHPAFRLLLAWGEFLTRCGCDVLASDTSCCDVPDDLSGLVPERLSKETFENWERGVEHFALMIEFQTVGIEMALAKLPPEQVLVLSYEHILDQPTEQFGILADFLGLVDPTDWAHEAAGLVRR